MESYTIQDRAPGQGYLIMPLSIKQHLPSAAAVRYAWDLIIIIIVLVVHHDSRQDTPHGQGYLIVRSGIESLSY